VPSGLDPYGPADHEERAIPVTTDDLAINRAVWNTVNADFTDRSAAGTWAAPEITWGLFNVAEREVGVLGEVADRDVVELGCGTAYFSAWLARAGARPVGVDLSPAQLATARRCQEESGLHFPLVEADAEAVPLRGERFDLVVSEYGASVWCDPSRWIPEAARLLRPGGRLVFLTNSVLASLCVPTEEGLAEERLCRPQRGMNRVRWPGGGVEYHPSHGDWVRILTANGFVVEQLRELYASLDADAPEYYEIASSDWAAKWPVEDLWSARLAE
jgi:SAM-dependent methyltransferase